MDQRLIDVNIAIKAIQNDCLDKVSYTKQDAIDCIEAQSAVEAAPVRLGEWIGDGKDHCCCSACNHGRNVATQIGWNYCPACGAKMYQSFYFSEQLR